MRAHSRPLVLAINNRVTPFPYQSLMPAGAGTPRYDNPELRYFAASLRGRFCRTPPRPQRGTSPSPRVVFDRATFSSPHASGLRRRIGVRGVLSRERRSGVAVWTQMVVSRLTFFCGVLVRGFPPSRE